MSLQEKTSERHFGIRIGAVSYLNTKPLIDGLESSLNNMDRLELDLPSHLADRLSNRSLDVALIPSIEFFQDEEYVIVSDACIACFGPVWSVKLLFRVPPREVKTIAFDEGSRTSAALSKILLYERFGIRPQPLPLPILSNPFEAEGDAILVIGDRAMKPKLDGFIEEWDLGDEWAESTGLPFVFAMWVSKRGRCPIELEVKLGLARDRGLAEASLLAEKYASDYGLTEEECFRYFRHYLRFVMGPLEQQGLELFYKKAVSLGLAPANRDISKFKMVSL